MAITGNDWPRWLLPVTFSAWLVSLVLPAVIPAYPADIRAATTGILTVVLGGPIAAKVARATKNGDG